MQNVALTVQGSAFSLSQVPGDLLHPLLRRMAGHAGQRHPPRFQLDRKQNVVRGQTSPREHLGGKEVHAGRNRHVGGDEVLPGSRLTGFRSWRDAVPTQNVPDRLVRDLVAEMGQSARDPVGAFDFPGINNTRVTMTAKARSCSGYLSVMVRNSLERGALFAVKLDACGTETGVACSGVEPFALVVEQNHPLLRAAEWIRVNRAANVKRHVPTPQFGSGGHCFVS
jgi:hypothetical protein